MLYEEDYMAGQTTYVDDDHRDADYPTAGWRAMTLPMLNWPFDLYAHFVEVDD